MVESSEALIENGRIAASADWQELLKLDNDPNRKIVIQEIVIYFSAVAASTNLTIIIDGKELLSKFVPVNTQVKLAFGGHLVFYGKRKKPPILIKVKDSALPTVTAWITGIKLPYRG